VGRTSSPRAQTFQRERLQVFAGSDPRKAMWYGMSMNLRMGVGTFTWAAALMIMGCGGAQTPSASQGGPQAPFGEMSEGQRAEYMKNTVTPAMGSLFRDFDHSRYRSFGCVSCHGGGVKVGNFKMPNPELPKLSTQDRFKKHIEKTPTMTKFMMEKVVPEMATLLGEPRYNPSTHKGFGCFRCHTQDT
jgi:hypothetical protein